MVTRKFTKDLSASQMDLSSRTLDILVARILRKVYLDMDQKSREEMDRIFAGTNDKDKENFLKKYIPNSEKLFEEEAKKLEKELKTEIGREAGA